MTSEGLLGRLMRAILAVSFTIGPVAFLAQSAPVQVLLVEKAPLRLVEYDYGGGAREVGLDGVLEVTIHNAGTGPVTVRDLDVHSLLFVNAKTGERFLLLHSCDCFFVTGDAKPPQSFLERQTHRLGPGVSQHFTIEEFGCGGGMWKPPPPGEYLVYYRVLPVSSEKVAPPQGEPPRPASAVIEECKKRLLSDEFWEGASTSPSLRVPLRKPVRKKVHA